MARIREHTGLACSLTLYRKTASCERKEFPGIGYRADAPCRRDYPIPGKAQTLGVLHVSGETSLPGQEAETILRAVATQMGLVLDREYMGVMPLVRPTVPMAETTSNSTSSEAIGSSAQMASCAVRTMYNPLTILSLQNAVRKGSYEDFRQYSALVDDESVPHTLRGLIGLSFDRCTPVPLEQVEPVESILRRFKSGAMANGSTLVVLAIADGKRAAAEADRALMGYTNIL